MKKILIIFSCVSMLFLCAGCGATKAFNEEKALSGCFDIYSPAELDRLKEEHLDIQSRNERNYTVSAVEGLAGHSLGGIIAVDDKLYVCDIGENKILVLDSEGNLLEEVGETGNGDLEFLRPMGIAYADGRFYVLDVQNTRIQILDENLEFEEQIVFDRKYAEDRVEYGSIAVNQDGDIYFSLIGISDGRLLVYRQSEGGFYELGENFAGTVFPNGDNSQLYAVNVGVLEQDKNNKGIRTGINYLYEIEGTGLQAVCELPYGLTATGFVMQEDRLFCVSASYSSVDCYAQSGEYLYSLAVTGDVQLYSGLAEGSNSVYYLTGGNGLHIVKE